MYRLGFRLQLLVVFGLVGVFYGSEVLSLTWLDTFYNDHTPLPLQPFNDSEALPYLRVLSINTV